MLSVRQLQEALKEKHLPINGRKADLILRIQDADPSGEWIREIWSANTEAEEETAEGNSADESERDNEIAEAEPA